MSIGSCCRILGLAGVALAIAACNAVEPDDLANGEAPLALQFCATPDRR